MKIVELIANTIDRMPSDYVFTYTDFNIDVKQKNTVVKALNMLVSAGKIAKLSKGKFYKPRRTQFGELKPSAFQIAKDFIEQDGKLIGYITGYAAFNTMGLTTQVSSLIQIGTNKYRRPLKRGSYTISFIVQPNKITAKNIELLRLLDAVRFIREIPASTADEACLKIKEIVRGLSVEQQTTFATLALKYTNYVRALCGAILENVGVETILLSKIEKSLNGVTEYKLPISEKTLPCKSKWNLK